MAMGIGAAAVVASVCAVILGEYPLTGATPWLAGAVFGVLLSEVALSVGKVRHPAVSVSVAASAALAVLYAAWISSGEGVAPYPAMAWPAAGLAAALAAWRCWPRSRDGSAAPGSAPGSG